MPFPKPLLLVLWLTAVASSSSAQTVDCGDARCFNGGTCLTQQDGTSGTTEYHCDCSATLTTGSAFAGRYCQYEATAFCPTNDGSNIKIFCVNDGTCKSDPYDGCDCIGPYTGFGCEFKIPEAQSGNVDGNHDTITSHTSIYSGTTTWPDPVDPTDGTDDDNDNDDDNYPAQSPSSHSEGLVGSLVYQDSQNNDHDDDADDDTTSPSNSINNGGYIGNQVIYNDKDNTPLPDDDDSIKEQTIPPVNDIDICTTDGSTLDATPLSFCVNGGTCLRRVTSLQGHAGCGCPDEWTGPHCELSVAIMEAAEAGAAAGPSIGKSFGVAVIVMAVLAITVVAVFATVMYCRSQKRRRQSAKASANNRLRWGAGYSDSDSKSDINLAPRQSFYEGDYPATTHLSSSRDPMAHFGHHVAKSIGEASNMSVNDGSAQEDQSEPEPQVYIGPPRDEDGHVLHSVEIL